jgi:DNA polymerase-1
VSGQTLYLIDGHAQFFRAYHAIRGGLSSPVTGEPTNLTFGFVGMLLKLLKEEHPEHLAVVIDASGDTGTFRSQLDPQYKTNRAPPPQDFEPQVQRCLTILRDLNIPVLAQEGVEADDVIATIVRRVRRSAPELRIRIVSKDKDLGQLLDDHTELFDVHTGQSLGVEQLFERKGVRPDQVVDMLALMGDVSDHIPGVAGVGPKTAAQLITTYGSIQGVLDHLDELTPKRREAIEAARARLPLNVALVTLRDDLDVPFELESARLGAQWREGLPLATLLSTMKDLAFNRHAEELKSIVGATGSAVASARSGKAEPQQGGASPATEASVEEAPLFQSQERSTSALSAQTRAGEYRVLRSREEVEAFVALARAAEVLAVDTETDGLAPRRANLCGISLSTGAGSGVYIPLRSPERETHLGLSEVTELLGPLLAGPAPPKCGHNLKFDLNVLRRHGLGLGGMQCDSMVASYLVDSSRSSHGLDGLARGLLGHECTAIDAVLGDGLRQRTFDEAPLEIAGPYAAEDADIALRLRATLLPKIEAMGLRSLFDRVEVPLVEVLAELEWNGIRVDRAELAEQREALRARIAVLRRQIVDAAPHPFSPDSPKQLAAVLFNRLDEDPPGLGLKVIRRNKTGPSTDQEVLDRLAADPTITSPLPGLIVEYRQLTKLVSTYLIALEQAIDPTTGRVHASFHQTVAATGRLSSSDPNLQNIPIRTELGKAIREAFLADPGHLFLAADYSQIELRVLAHLSGDPALIEAFRRGMDIHTAVAAEVFGVPASEVTKEQRGTAKMVNFGIVYGVTAFGLARRLGAGTSTDRAARIIADYKARFARIDAFLDSCVEFARQHGYVETVLKRRRAVPQVHSRNPQERALGERVAINTVVQGSAADLIKVAMVDLHRALRAEHPSTRMLLQIHDELVFEVPEESIDAVQRVVVDRMTSAMQLAVPLIVETAVGRTWSEV